MTKDINITIIGKQKGMEEDAVTITASGSYHLMNGKHFIQYDEVNAENGSMIKSSLKISNAELAFTKKDVHPTQMFFVQNMPTQMDYQTPYGCLILDVNTKVIELQESSDQIDVRLEYTLSNNDSPISENILHIIIKSV